MKSVISDEIRTNGALWEAVREGDALLATVLGPSADLVEATWRLEKDVKERPLLNLSITDWTGSVSARFTPDELSKPYHLYSRLHRLWGDLLQVRSTTQLKKLDESIKEVVGGA